MNASPIQLDTLRNLSSAAEKLGLHASSQAGFIGYSKAIRGEVNQETVNTLSHNIREIIRWAKGSAFADSIA
jgi:hypothetical protein